jgi:hypothetical protein
LNSSLTLTCLPTKHKTHFVQLWEFSKEIWRDNYNHLIECQYAMTCIAAF